MKIEFTRTPTTTELDFLTEKINHETQEFGEAFPFAFFVRDEQNQIIAGCNGSVIFLAIFTQINYGCTQTIVGLVWATN